MYFINPFDFWLILPNVDRDHKSSLLNCRYCRWIKISRSLNAGVWIKRMLRRICYMACRDCNALIAVDEILFVLESNLDFKMERSIAYYLEVKQEIEKL